MSSKEFPPRINVSISDITGVLAVRLDQSNPIEGYCTSDYLSIAEHAHLIAEKDARINELEQRIKFMLDDVDDLHYRNQAAKSIGYSASFPGRNHDQA